MVDLPSIGKAPQTPEKVIEVVVQDDQRVRLRVNSQDADTLAVDELAERVKALQGEAEGGPSAVPVIISARKDVRYEEVVRIMDVLQKAGVARVGLSVRTTGG